MKVSETTEAVGISEEKVKNIIRGAKALRKMRAAATKKKQFKSKRRVLIGYLYKDQTIIGDNCFNLLAASICKKKPGLKKKKPSFVRSTHLYTRVYL